MSGCRHCSSDQQHVISGCKQARWSWDLRSSCAASVLIDVVNRRDSITLQASLTPAFNQLINRELLHTLVRAEIVIPFPTAVEIQRHEG